MGVSNCISGLIFLGVEVRENGADGGAVLGASGVGLAGA
jgi:hypothetical protein